MRAFARAFLFTVAGAGWGLGVNIALQKGWLNRFPDLGVSALFIIPMLICIYLAMTHETVRQYHYLLRKYRVMSLVIFIVVGALISALIWYAIYKLPFQQPILAAQQDAKPKLTLLKVPDKEFIFSGRDAIKLSPEFFRDRKQYRLVVENESQADLTDLKFDIQFPYPVETSFVNANYEARGIVFKPQNMDMTAQGNVEAPRLFTSIYELSATELIKQKAWFEVVLVLNSWRDPRGKEIPEKDRQTYGVPESGPLITYIDGGFKIKAEDGRTRDEHYYKPIILNDDKTISLGSLTEPPDKLIHRTLHVTSLPPYKEAAVSPPTAAISNLESGYAYGLSLEQLQIGRDDQNPDGHVLQLALILRNATDGPLKYEVKSINLNIGGIQPIDAWMNRGGVIPRGATQIFYCPPFDKKITQPRAEGTLEYAIEYGHPEQGFFRVSKKKLHITLRLDQATGLAYTIESESDERIMPPSPTPDKATSPH